MFRQKAFFADMRIARIDTNAFGSGMGYTKVGGTQAGRAFSYEKYRYGFNGKEKLTEGTADNYDFGARVYDGRLGRWLSVDPLFAKYPDYSPYNFGINNPLIVIDRDGRDIIVLCAKQTFQDADAGASGHPTGHQAILVGNDENGWNYYSFDGSVKQDGSDGKTIGVHFAHLSEFTLSDFNTYKNNYDDGQSYATSHVDKDGNILQRYTEGFRITTSEATDKKMDDATGSYLKTAEYSMFNRDECTSVAKTALESAGLHNGEISSAPCSEGPDFHCTVLNVLPQEKQAEIERGNTGIDIDDKLNPKKVEIK